MMTGPERDQLTSILAMLNPETLALVRNDLERYRNDAAADNHESVNLAADALAALEVTEAENAALDAAQH